MMRDMEEDAELVMVMVEALGGKTHGWQVVDGLFGHLPESFHSFLHDCSCCKTLQLRRLHVKYSDEMQGSSVYTMMGG